MRRSHSRTDDPFLAPHRWLVRLGSRFYYPIAAVAVTLIIGIVVRDTLRGVYLRPLRQMADLVLIGGMCVLVLYWRSERMWARGQNNWLVRFTRPDLAFLWSGLAVIFIALGNIALVLVAPTTTVANHLWPLFLFPLLFLSERGDTVPFLFVLGLTGLVVLIFRYALGGASLAAIVTPSLWLAVLATSNYYLARRHLLLELRADILRQIANQFSTIPDVEKSFATIIETIGRRLRYDHLRLWLLDEAGERLVLHAAWGTPPEQWQGLALPLGHSIPGAVVGSEQLERWDDVKDCPHYAAQPPFEWTTSALAVPIRAAGTTVGALEALSAAPAEFWELDEDNLALMADSIGIALARNRHVRREAARLRDTLWGAVTRLNDCTSIQEMFDTIAREAQSHLGADLVVLYQLAPGTGYPLTPPLFMGDFHDAETLRQPTLPEDSVLFDLLEKWAPYYSAEAQSDPVLSRGGLETEYAQSELVESGLSLPYGTRNRFIVREAVRAAAFLPLGPRSERVGALFLHYRARREFSPLDKLSLEAFASLVAEQINRERAHWRKYEAFGGVLFGVHGPLTLSADSLRRLTGTARDVLRSDPATAEAALEQAQQVARKLELAAMLTRLSKRDEDDPTSLADELRRAATKVLQFIEPDCRVRIDIPAEADDLPFELLDAIYCLAIEAIVNAAYHGHAQRIDIAVELESKRIRLHVTDAGQGFDPASARPGPNGIFEGLDLVRGQFAARGSVASQPGAGAQVEVTFPCLSDVINLSDLDTD